jgi:hypothetical protein
MYTHIITPSGVSDDPAPLAFKVSFWNLFAVGKGYPTEAQLPPDATLSEIMAQLTLNLGQGKTWPEEMLVWYYNGDGITDNTGFNNLNPLHAWAGSFSVSVTGSKEYVNNSVSDKSYAGSPDGYIPNAVVRGVGQPYFWFGEAMQGAIDLPYEGLVWNYIENKQGSVGGGGTAYFKFVITSTFPPYVFLANNIKAYASCVFTGDASVDEWVSPCGSYSLSGSLNNTQAGKEYDAYYGHYVETYYKMIGTASGQAGITSYQLPRKNSR